MAITPESPLNCWHANLVAQRVARGEKASCHGLVDERHSGAAFGLRFIPQPALKQWDLQYGKYSLLTQFTAAL
jgi:hypothetical protein